MTLEINPLRGALTVLSFGLLALACADSGAESPSDSPSPDVVSPPSLASVDTASLDGDVDSGPTAANASPPLELTPDLCDDASRLEGVLNAFVGSDGDPSFGEINTEQVQRMLDAPTEGPFYMVNLIRYRDQARYPDGRETTLTGREANALYSPVEFIAAIGAQIVYVGEADRGEDDMWDDVAIVEYPCPLAFFAMSAHPDFQARAVHKEAGVESTIVMVTHLLPLPDAAANTTPFPPTADDPAFNRVRVHHYRDQARYEDGSSRTGEEAKDRYISTVGDAERAQGITPQFRASVQGVFIGDGRSWDEVWIDFVPSQAALEAAMSDPTVAGAQHHLDAALEDAYEVFAAPLISTLPGAANGSDQSLLPVTADGTGTSCQTDDDCPGDGVDTCFMPTEGFGFCTRQGCGAGECQSPYLCCHDCSELAAPILPFEGSICLPASGTDQLTAAPVSCTCD